MPIHQLFLPLNLPLQVLDVPTQGLELSFKLLDLLLLF